MLSYVPTNSFYGSTSLVINEPKVNPVVNSIYTVIAEYLGGTDEKDWTFGCLTLSKKMQKIIIESATILTGLGMAYASAVTYQSGAIEAIDTLAQAVGLSNPGLIVFLKSLSLYGAMGANGFLGLGFTVTAMNAIYRYLQRTDTAKSLLPEKNSLKKRLGIITACAFFSVLACAPAVALVILTQGGLASLILTIISNIPQNAYAILDILKQNDFLYLSSLSNLPGLLYHRLSGNLYSLNKKVSQLHLQYVKTLLITTFLNKIEAVLKEKITAKDNEFINLINSLTGENKEQQACPQLLIKILTQQAPAPAKTLNSHVLKLIGVISVSIGWLSMIQYLLSTVVSLEQFIGPSLIAPAILLTGLGNTLFFSLLTSLSYSQGIDYASTFFDIFHKQFTLSYPFKRFLGFNSTVFSAGISAGLFSFAPSVQLAYLTLSGGLFWTVTIATIISCLMFNSATVKPFIIYLSMLMGRATKDHGIFENLERLEKLMMVLSALSEDKILMLLIDLDSKLREEKSNNTILDMLYAKTESTQPTSSANNSESTEVKSNSNFDDDELQKLLNQNEIPKQLQDEKPSYVSLFQKVGFLNNNHDNNCGNKELRIITDERIPLLAS